MPRRRSHRGHRPRTKVRRPLPLDAPPASAIVAATLPGTCASCGSEIRPGQIIEPRRRRWHHAECLLVPP